MSLEHGIFDAHDPPDPDLIADCVHCGFCLPACPTYSLWGEEMDSPRGRIHLMTLGLEGEVALDETYAGHFDACLGCMACVTACPSGVQYDKLIESTRAQIERNHPRTRAERVFRRALFWLFPHPARLRVAAVLAWAYQRLRIGGLLRRSGLRQRLPARLRALESLLPQVRLRSLRLRLPERIGAHAEPRMRVALLTGCVQSVFFAEVNAATARVLAADGCDVLVPRDQGCCGALEVHAGEQGAALDRARALIAAMEAADADRIVVNAAGCGSNLADYGHLLRDDPAWAARAAAFSAKVADVSVVLAELGPVATRHAIAARVVYQDACHLAHAQGVRSQPRAILRAIPDLELAQTAESDTCCGSAGVYNLLQPDAAEELGRRKAGHIAAAQPDAVASGNPGCTLHLRRWLDVPIFHPVQLVDASIRGVDLIQEGTA